MSTYRLMPHFIPIREKSGIINNVSHATIEWAITRGKPPVPGTGNLLSPHQTRTFDIRETAAPVIGHHCMPPPPMPVDPYGLPHGHLHGPYHVHDMTLFIRAVDMPGGASPQVLIQPNGCSTPGVPYNVSGLSLWCRNTVYEQDTFVAHDLQIWQCNTAHTSGNEFDPNYWTCFMTGVNDITFDTASRAIVVTKNGCEQTMMFIEHVDMADKDGKGNIIDRQYATNSALDELKRTVENVKNGINNSIATLHSDLAAYATKQELISQKSTIEDKAAAVYATKQELANQKNTLESNVVANYATKQELANQKNAIENNAASRYVTKLDYNSIINSLNAFATRDELSMLRTGMNSDIANTYATKTELRQISSNANNLATKSDVEAVKNSTVRQAQCDAQGNIIDVTYARHQDITSAVERVKQGQVNQAVCDELGRRIAGTYITSAELKAAINDNKSSVAAFDDEGHNIALYYLPKKEFNSFVQSGTGYAATRDGEGNVIARQYARKADFAQMVISILQQLGVVDKDLELGSIDLSKLSGVDQWVKDENGGISPSADNNWPTDSVAFYQNLDGSIQPAPRMFYSKLFKYEDNGEGGVNIVPRGDDTEGTNASGCNCVNMTSEDVDALIENAIQSVYGDNQSSI